MRLKPEYFIIALLLPCLYISVLVFNSYRVQLDLLYEFNKGVYNEETTAKFINLNTDFPNIGVTTIPIDHFLSKYYFLSGDFKKSLELIESGNLANPYIKSGSMYKAELYEYLEVYDSMYFYSKDAFNKMPRTTKHYLYYNKALFKLNKAEEFLNSFIKIKDFKEPEFVVSYLVTLNQFGIKNDSLVSQVTEIRNKFSKNDLVKIAVDHYLYGKENVEESIRFTNEAVEFFQASQFENAIDKFKSAAELNPGEYSNFENIGLCYFKLEKFDKAVEFLNTVIEQKNRPQKGKSELYLGLSYIKIGELSKGCEMLNRAKSFNIAESYKYISKNCTNS